MRILFALCSSLALAQGQPQVPDNLVVEGVPEFSPELKADVGRYLEFRSAGFSDWHPTRREALITTRFADSTQLHLVKTPGGARRQLTFLPEPVASGSFRPKTGDCLVFGQDTGGGEFYQLYRSDLGEGRITLLTDGKSRNTGARWSQTGRWLAYTSTRRNGKDNDIYVMDPADPKRDRRVLEVTGGGWRVADWSEDDAKLLLLEYLSINESYLHLLDVATGTTRLVTPKGGPKVAYGQVQFAKDGQSLFVTTDRDSEFQRLARLNLATGQLQDQLRCGVDVVGISSFLTFLKNTQDYRRDLRRVEYGDEREEKMREFLERISPANQADRIRRPLFVVQGKNDPRVPVTESEQMVKAIRNHGGTVWYLMAKDEGHGFAKKKNADFQFLATIQFLKEFLLK